VLSGGYLEEVVGDITTASESGCIIGTRHIRWWNVVNGNHFHRIRNAKPNTWTLFFHGPRVMVRQGQASKPKGWGFLERKYLVGHHDSIYFVPWPSAASQWWLDAPTGENVGRQPL